MARQRAEHEVDVVDELLDELRIRGVLEQYCRYIDDGQGAMALQLFAADCTFQMLGRSFDKSGLASLWGTQARKADRPATMHALTNVVVSVDGDLARAESDWIMLTRSSEDGAFRIEVAGRYRDQLRRDADRWLFVERIAIAMARPPKGR
jgi:3-phenylpropionate/cinnamic acid dioxygenase small subunit